MSPGMPWSPGYGGAACSLVPELSGAVNPAWAITYAVRPEQSKPIWVPQELYWPPPRAQPLVGPEEPAPRPAARRTPRKPSTTATPAEVTPAAEPGPQRPAAHNPDAKPGEQHPGEATFKLTVNVAVSLHQRASGVVRYAEMTGEPEEILSLTDLVRNALAELVTHYEKKYNEGAPFPTPKRLRRGRR